MTDLNNYMAENEKFMDENTAAALGQIPADMWPSVVAAAQEFCGSDEPGMDCGIAITHETLADFRDSRANYWSKPGAMRDHVFGTRAAIEFSDFQRARGMSRSSMMVVDLGDIRVALVSD